MQQAQADGRACRAWEMFQALGFADKLRRGAIRVAETTFWKPDRWDPVLIGCSDRVGDMEDAL